VLLSIRLRAAGHSLVAVVLLGIASFIQLMPTAATINPLVKPSKS